MGFYILVNLTDYSSGHGDIHLLGGPQVGCHVQVNKPQPIPA